MATFGGKPFMSGKVMDVCFIKKRHKSIHIQQIAHSASSLNWFTTSNVTGVALVGRCTIRNPLRMVCPLSDG